MKLHGMVCATITPMTSSGEIDLDSCAGLCEYLVTQGVPCLYPNGTNGESLLLSVEERKAQAEAILKANRGRSTVYIQCGAVRRDDTYDLTRHAARCGADGAGIMTPLFFPVDEKTMRIYYEEILDELPQFPIYLYNISANTGNDVSAELLGRLLDAHDNLMGIKYSSGDLVRLGAYLRSCKRRKPDVLIGNDALALCCLTSGGAGYVSGPGAVFPRLYASLYDSYARGDLASAQEAQDRIIGIIGVMQGIPEIPAIKYMLWRKGIISAPVCRGPLRGLDAEEKRRLDRLLAETIC